MATAAYVCNCNFDSSKRTIEILPSLGEFEKIPKTQRSLIEAQAQQFCSTLEIKNIRFQLAISIDVSSLRAEDLPSPLASLPSSFPTFGSTSFFSPNPLNPNSSLPSSFPTLGSTSFFSPNPLNPNSQTKTKEPLFQPIKERDFEQTNQSVDDFRADQKPKFQKYITDKSKTMENYRIAIDPKEIFNSANVNFKNSTKEKELEDWILKKFENIKSRECRTCPFFHDHRMFIIHFHTNRNCTYALSLAVWENDSKAEGFIYNMILTKSEDSVVFPRSIVALLTCKVFVKINLRNYPGSFKPQSFFSVSIFASFIENFSRKTERFCYFREMLKTFTKREKICICSLDGWKDKTYTGASGIEEATMVDALNLITFFLFKKISCSWKDLCENLSDETFQKLQELQKRQRNLDFSKESKEWGAEFNSSKSTKEEGYHQQDSRSKQSKFHHSAFNKFGVSNPRRNKTQNQKQTNWEGFASSSTEKTENAWASTDLETWNTSTYPEESDGNQPKAFNKELETWKSDGSW